MNKKKSQPLPNQDLLASSVPSYTEIQDHVFSVRKDGLYLGGNKIEPTLRSLLKDDAETIKNSRLWEILNASLLNEAFDLALIQSTDFEQVQFAKALKHAQHFILNVIFILSKKD